ncbi:hypothetical protein CKF46_37425, partial [Klebsiella pneumoniae]
MKLSWEVWTGSLPRLHKVFTLLDYFVSILIHAWIGMWQVKLSWEVWTGSLPRLHKVFTLLDYFVSILIHAW